MEIWHGFENIAEKHIQLVQMDAHAITPFDESALFASIFGQASAILATAPSQDKEEKKVFIPAAIPEVSPWADVSDKSIEAEGLRAIQEAQRKAKEEQEQKDVAEFCASFTTSAPKFLKQQLAILAQIAVASYFAMDWIMELIGTPYKVSACNKRGDKQHSIAGCKFRHVPGQPGLTKLFTKHEQIFSSIWALVPIVKDESLPLHERAEACKKANDEFRGLIQQIKGLISGFKAENIVMVYEIRTLLRNPKLFSEACNHHFAKDKKCTRGKACTFSHYRELIIEAGFASQEMRLAACKFGRGCKAGNACQRLHLAADKEFFPELKEEEKVEEEQEQGEGSSE